MSGGAWFVIGILVASIVAPTITVAAVATLVRIKGSSGNIAQVDSSGRLEVNPGPTPVATFDKLGRQLTGDAPVSSWFSFESGMYQGTNTITGDQPNYCFKLFDPTTTTARIIKVVDVDWVEAVGDGNHFVAFYLGPTNSATCGNQTIRRFDAATAGIQQVTFDPGFVVPPGATMGIEVFGPGIEATVGLSGYFIPASGL